MLREIYGHVMLDIMKYEGEDDKTYFNPTVTFAFSKNETDRVTICTDIHVEDPLEALGQCLHGMGHIFVGISANVTIYDAETGETIEEIDLNEIFPIPEETFHKVSEKKIIFH